MRFVAVLFAAVALAAVASAAPTAPTHPRPADAAVQACPATGVALGVTYECTLGVGETKSFSTGVHGITAKFAIHMHGYNGLLPVGRVEQTDSFGCGSGGSVVDHFFTCSGVPHTSPQQINFTIRDANFGAGTVRFSVQRADAGGTINGTPILLGTPMHTTLEAGGMVTKTITATQFQGFLIWQGSANVVGGTRTLLYDAAGNELCNFFVGHFSAARDCGRFAAGPLTFITYQDQGDDRPLSQVTYDTGLAANADAPVMQHGEIVAGTTPEYGMARYRVPMVFGDDIITRAGALTDQTEVDGIVPTLIMATTDDDETCTNGAQQTLIAESRCDAFAPATTIIYVDLQRVAGARSFWLQAFPEVGGSYAVPIGYPTDSVRGVIATAGETDIYTYVPEQGSDAIYFDEPPGRSLKIEVYDPSWTLRCTVTEPLSQCPFFDVPAATWHLYVRDEVTAPLVDETGPYQIQIFCSLFCFPDPEPDIDLDGVPNANDTCPTISGAQTNTDAAPLTTPGALDDVTRPADDSQGDICDPDDDNDGLLDAAEAEGCGAWGSGAATNPLLFDTDGDRSSDWYECAVGTNPASAASKPALASLGGTDNDALPLTLERLFASSDTDTDSDDDGVQDGLEVRGHGSQPANVDSDYDLCPDDTEVASINGDTVVNAIDLNQVAQRFFMPDKPMHDVNKDGTVGALDLLLLAQNFQLSPCTAG